MDTSPLNYLDVDVYFIIHGLIYDQKPYVPIAEQDNK